MKAAKTHNKSSHLLVEVAVVQAAVPTDADGVAAHEPLGGGGVVGVDQEGHVLVQLVAPLRGRERSGFTFGWVRGHR